MSNLGSSIDVLANGDGVTATETAPQRPASIMSRVAQAVASWVPFLHQQQATKLTLRPTEDMIDSAAASRAPSLLAPITTPKGQDAARFSVDTPSTTRLTNKMPTDSAYSPSGGSKVTGVGPAPQGGNSGPSTFLSSGPTAAQSGPANPNPSYEPHGPEFLGNFAAKSLGSAAHILQSGPIHKIGADMGFEILGTPQISKTCSVENTIFDTNTPMSTQPHILLGNPITHASQN